MDTRQAVLEKVARLLALGANNANEHEAANAMAAAARLMEQHKIDQAAIDALASEDDAPEPIEVDVFTVGADEGTTMVANWRWTLVFTLARLHGCHGFITRRAADLDGPKRLEWRVVGDKLDASAVRYLYAYAARQIETLTKRALDNGMGSGRTWANSFRMGCADRVASRYSEALRKVRAETRATATGGALVRVDERADQIALAVRERKAKLNLRSTRGGGARSDRSARDAGRLAGDRVDLGLGRSAALGAGAAGAIGADR